MNYLSEDQGRPSGQDQDPIDQQMRARSNKREIKHQTKFHNQDVKETVRPHLIKIWGRLNRRDIRRKKKHKISFSSIPLDLFLLSINYLKRKTNNLKISKFTKSNVQFWRNIVIQYQPPNHLSFCDFFNTEFLQSQKGEGQLFLLQKLGEQIWLN